MKHKNYLTQVVWLFVLTVGILMVISALPPLKIHFEAKPIDLFSNLRSTANNENKYEDEFDNFLDSLPTDSLSDNTSVGADDNTASLVKSDTVATTQRTLSKEQIKERIKQVHEFPHIEDFSYEQNGLSHFTQSINNINTLNRPVRITYIGDSFIEADIFTQNVRELLQDTYGGCGVGYMALHSDFPGFRRSIVQADNDWTVHNVLSNEEYSHTSLPLQHVRANASGFTQFRGVTKLRNILNWEVSKLAFIADQDATITLKTDSALHTYDVTAGERAQLITLNEPTALLEVKCSSPDVAIWGAWLDAQQGIAVDNISMRGYSGTTIDMIPIDNLQRLDEIIPSDLIILQYGLNRMTPSITNYNDYTTQLVDAINHLRKAFPNTDILIMGISDRCENVNGEIVTMEAVYGMRNAQRKAAIQTGCLFWDTCAAMKSLGGIPQFVEYNWANKDFTHINHAGGRPLAEVFIKALNLKIEEDSAQ